MFQRAFPIVFLLSLNGAASAQTAPSADELAARNIAARGGIEKIRALQTLTGTGTLILPNGIELPLTVYVKRPRLMRIETVIQGKSMVMAFDGTDSWSINSLTGSGEPQKADEAESSRARESSDSMMDGDLIDYKDKGSQLEFAGNEDAQGRPAYKLKLTTKSGTVNYIYLDAETFLDSKVVQIKNQAGKETRFEVYPTAYKPVAGVMTPHSIEMKKEGMAFKVVLENLASNVDLDDSLFQFPVPGSSRFRPSRQLGRSARLIR